MNGDREIRQREAGGVRIRVVERLLRRLERLVGDGGEERIGDGPADAGRDDAGAGDRGVEAHRNGLARVRRSRSGDHQHRLRAALTRRERLVAKIRVPGENRLRLRLRILGEVAQHEDDLVLHVERRVAVVRESLSVGDDDAVAGEDDLAGHVAVVGEGERLDVGREAKVRRRPRVRPDAPAIELPPSRVPAVKSKATR